MTPEATYLVEIIYPENRIVVKYEFAGLVLLTMYDGFGREIDYEGLKLEGKYVGLPVVDKISCNSINDLLDKAKTIDCNQEGWVLHFDNGFRLKIKGDQYCRVHRMISNCTPLAVWDMIRHKENIDEVKKELPEEFHHDLDIIRCKIEAQFEKAYENAKAFYESTLHLTDKKLAESMQDGLGAFEPISKSVVYACRKKDWFNKVLETPDAEAHPRMKFFKHIRPNNNNLEGYTPSNVMNRFQEEIL